MKSFSGLSRREAALALLAATLPLRAAQGNDYPNRPIKLIVPVPPGSGVDAVSRSVGAQMSESMGVPIVADYRPGASAVVGSEALAKSPPDGYTIMMGYTAHSTNPLFNPSLPYDTLRDFTPIVYVCYIPAVLMVHPSTPANTVRELVDMMKQKPGNYTYASGGAGATAHLSGELLKHLTGVDHPARSLQGQCAGAQRPARRPCHDDVRHRLDRAAADQGGQAEGARGHEREALTGRAGAADHDRVGLPRLRGGRLVHDAGAGQPAEGRPGAPQSRGQQGAADGAPCARRSPTSASRSPAERPSSADAFLRAEMKKWAEVVAATGIKAQ